MSVADFVADAVDFVFDIGMYIQLHAHGANGVAMACAVARAATGDYAGARELLDDRILAAQPGPASHLFSSQALA
ncbi:hypothetical protein [Mycobacterium tilburgii]